MKLRNNKKLSIEIIKLDKARNGYKVLPSWRRPNEPSLLKKVDLWLPEISAGLSLMRDYRRGNIGWQEMATQYGWELRSPLMQNFLKPLALLSMRRKLILLCDCVEGVPCPNKVLIEVLEEYRNKNDFVLRL